MKHSFPRPLALLAVVLLTVTLLGACASTQPAGPPPEQLVEETVMAVLAKLAEGDIDSVMAVYAEDFSSDQGDKAAMDAFLTGAADAGFLDGMTSNTEAMVVAVEGDAASVSGLTIEGAFGLLDLAFDLENRDGQWLIVKQTQQ